MKNQNQKLKTSKYLVVIAAIFIAAFFSLFNFGGSNGIKASVFGPSPSFTGAPLENNCTACHSTFPVDSGSGNVRITGIPKNYLPNQSVPITITVNDSNAVLYGFQMVVVNKLGESVGTLTVPSGSPAQMQIVSGFVNGNSRQYIEHTNNGVVPTQFGSKSWTFNWTPPSVRSGKLSFFAAGNGANSDSTSGNDQIYTTSGSTLSGTAISNFDSDFSSDVSVFRPSTGTWYATTSGGEYQVVAFGQNNDIPTPGDYDGDGKTDYAVFRPSNGTWYVRTASTYSEQMFGIAGDIPVPGDYDGDGKSDPAVFRPSNGTWYLYGSVTGFSAIAFGTSSDKTAQADFDGDGKTDLAYFRPSTGTWFVRNSSTLEISSRAFGTAGDLPVQGDYNGDGLFDYAVYRPSEGRWYTFTASGFGSMNFGTAEDKPAPADYDGDGITDFAVFRPSTGDWHIFASVGPIYSSRNFGVGGDIPIPSAYLAP